MNKFQCQMSQVKHIVLNLFKFNLAYPPSGLKTIANGNLQSLQ